MVSALGFWLQMVGSPLPAATDNAGLGKIQFVTPSIGEGPASMFREMTLDFRGYHYMAGDESYIKIVDTLLAQMCKANATVSVHSAIAPDGAEVGSPLKICSFQEDDSRVSHFFRLDNGRKALLTIWNVRKAGASLLVPKNFLNAAVNGYPATLTFVVWQGEPKKGIWKLTWWSDSVQHEFYVEDSIYEGLAAGTADDVLQLATCVVALVHPLE